MVDIKNHPIVKNRQKVQKYTLDEIKILFNEVGYKLLSTDYKPDIKLKYVCNQKHEAENYLKDFIYGTRCIKCRIEYTANNNRRPWDDLVSEFDKYNLKITSSADDYKNERTSIIKFVCNKNHENECTMKSFLTRKRKCLTCGKKNIAPQNVYTIEYVKELCDTRGFTLISDVYENRCKPFDIICDKGHNTQMLLEGLRNNRPCKICKGSKGSAKTIENIQLEFEQEGFTLISTEYKGYYGPLEYICPKNHNIKATYGAWKNTKHKCITCRYQELGDQQRLTYDFVKSKFEDKNYRLLSKIYIDSHTKLEYMCNEGHYGTITFNDFYHHGHSCYGCFGIKPYTITEVQNIFNSVGYKLLSNKYINDSEKLIYMCPDSHINEVRLNNFLRGTRCPDCMALVTASKGELVIRKYLEDNNIKFVSQHKFNDCINKRQLPFDFYVNDDFLIEFDGKQHFEPVKYYGGFDDYLNRVKCDNIKTTYCIKNHIPLLRISYKEQKQIDELIKDFMETYDKNNNLITFSNNLLYKDQIDVYSKPIV